jgi:hypothetical protein
MNEIEESHPTIFLQVVKIACTIQHLWPNVSETKTLNIKPVLRIQPFPSTIASTAARVVLFELHNWPIESLQQVC